MRAIGCIAPAVAAASLVLASCSNGLAPAGAELPAVGALPDLPSLSSLPSLASLTQRPVVGSPTEVYTRIAHGAVTCWFGASGPLKGRHIYHAQAEPASKGGQAEIVIFVRDKTAADPRSLRAFRVIITPIDTTAKIEVENSTIVEPLATRLRSDVDRWAAGEESCGQNPVTEGWSARDAAKAAASNAKSPKKK